MIDLGLFELEELLTLAMSIVAFAFVYRAYRQASDTPPLKNFWAYFLLISAFILLNRISTNIEGIALKTFFNLVQHLSNVAVAVVFVMIVRKSVKGAKNG